MDETSASRGYDSLGRHHVPPPEAMGVPGEGALRSGLDAQSHRGVARAGGWPFDGALLSCCLFHGTDNLHGLDTYSRDTLHELNNSFLVISEFVGIELFPNGWILQSLLFVLFKDPFDGASIPEHVFPCLLRHPGESSLGIELNYSVFLVYTEEGLRRKPR
jgi:hypothetical protein